MGGKRRHRYPKECCVHFFERRRHIIRHHLKLGQIKKWDVLFSWSTRYSAWPVLDWSICSSINHYTFDEAIIFSEALFPWIVHEADQITFLMHLVTLAVVSSKFEEKGSSTSSNAEKSRLVVSSIGFIAKFWDKKCPKKLLIEQYTIWKTKRV